MTMMRGVKTGRRQRRVVYIQCTNPYIYPPLEHSAKIFAAHDWEVVFLGIHVEGVADGLRFGRISGPKVELLQRWGSGLLLKLHFVWFLLWCWWKILIMRPALLYVSDPITCPVGTILALATSIPVVYHEHDSPSDVPNSVVESVVLIFRKALAKTCFACALPNETRAATFATTVHTTKPIICVMNCPSVHEIDQRINSSVASGTLRVYYHGSIVPARLPIAVLDALSMVPEAALTVVGYETSGHPDYVKYLSRQVALRGLESRVRFTGIVTPREELLTLCSQHHVGLALVPKCTSEPNFRAMAGASNKVFDYLANSLSVLVSDLPDHRRLFVDRGVAKSCDPEDPRSLASAFQWFLDHPLE